MATRAGTMTAASDSTVSPRAERLAEILRDVTRGGIAGLVAGLVVGGGAGRLAMTIAARLNPQATGALTESSQAVGRFTLDGTLTLFFFGGITAGMMAGAVWVVISPWLPRAGARRTALAFPIAALVGSASLIESTNTDFEVLDHDLVLIGLLLAVAGLVGAATAWLDGRLERRLPRSGSAPLRVRLGAYGAIALLGSPALLLTLMSFFYRGFSLGNEPALVGVALLGCGAATLAWWRMRPLGSTHPNGRLVTFGRLSLLAAVILGAIHLSFEAAKILAVA